MLMTKFISPSLGEDSEFFFLSDSIFALVIDIVYPTDPPVKTRLSLRLKA
jgi:hypothetical protein